MLKIFYQWVPWAYSNIVSEKLSQKLEIENIWLETFSQVFEKISEWNIGVLPIENSYAGAVFENLHLLKDFDFEIVAQYLQPVDHCICWVWDFEDIKQVYSHPQALMQTADFCKQHNIKQIAFGDTAWAAEFVNFEQKKEYGAICSSLWAKINNLKIFKEKIQDQDWNTTRFFVVLRKSATLMANNKNFEQKKILEKINQIFPKVNKTSIFFETKHMPWSLYKCLWAFATRDINLSKIESLPTKNSPFEYMFWIDFENPKKPEYITQVFEELNFFSKNIKILWSY